MPEPPEVETLRRDLEKEVVGKRIKQVDVSGMRSIRRHPNKKHFAGKLEGHKIMGVDRRGKYLLVKLEGGDEEMADHVHALVRAGIPVMGHIGLTPQSVHALGGYRVQGRDDAEAGRLKADATALQDAGAFAMVLELVPAPLASQITKALTIPTIGIGAGPACDGQVLVLHDMLGLNDQFSAKFIKKYAALAEDVREAARVFAAEVREGRYPGPEHSFGK